MVVVWQAVAPTLVEGCAGAPGVKKPVKAKMVRLKPQPLKAAANGNNTEVTITVGIKATDVAAKTGNKVAPPSSSSPSTTKATPPAATAVEDKGKKVPAPSMFKRAMQGLQKQT